MRPLVIALLAALALPVSADAATLAGRPLEKGLWGPVTIDGVSQFPVYRDLDVSLFQIQLRWERVARSRPADPANPDDPAYRWPQDLDLAVEEGRRHGIRVLVLIQGTPGWANQGLPWTTPPDDPRDYAAFVTAAARRYPGVRHWMIWGEPLRNVNWPGFDRSRPGRLRIAGSYARLLDAAYVALKRVSRRNLVIGGNSFTTDREPVSWAPVPLFEWMRILRLPNGRPPRMDIWGHNPFTVRIPRLRDPPAANQGDFSDLDRVLTRLRRHVGRPLKRRVPLFVSEFCLPTGPNDLFPLELTQAQQATWLRRAFAIARARRDIWGMGWWELKDDRPPAGSDRANRCGLLDADGRPKSAYGVFKRARTSRR
ncbi:MAG TPA: hypothetical protein VHF89_20765 [Solirubrobacteraceae bacterium]|nr:hypothetical protein [Solirubrobacteraceae bacterium]